MLDVKLTPYKTSERDLALQHLEHAEENDLILYDRGHPVFWLILVHKAFKRDFCMRVRSNFNNQVKALRLYDPAEVLIEPRYAVGDKC